MEKMKYGIENQVLLNCTADYERQISKQIFKKSSLAWSG